MRKSHTQKVADRRKKRQRSGRQKFYNGLVAKFTRQLKEMQASPLDFVFCRPHMTTSDWQSPHQFPRANVLFPDIVLSEKQSAHLLDQARRMDEVIQTVVTAMSVPDEVEPMPPVCVTNPHWRNWDSFFEEKSRAYAKDAAEKAFIAPIINTNPSAEPTEKGE